MKKMFLIASGLVLVLAGCSMESNNQRRLDNLTYYPSANWDGREFEKLLIDYGRDRGLCEELQDSFNKVADTGDRFIATYIHQSLEVGGCYD